MKTKQIESDDTLFSELKKFPEILPLKHGMYVFMFSQFFIFGRGGGRGHDPIKRWK